MAFKTVAAVLLHPGLQAGSLLEDLLDAEIRVGARMRVEYERIAGELGLDAQFRIVKVGLPASGELEVGVGTDHTIFRYLNDGTGQAGGFRGSWYPINPRNADAIAFPKNFSPKSSPGTLQIRPGGGKSGPVRVEPQGVFHPGVEPREWDQLIADQFQDEFVEEMVTTINKWILRNV